VDCVRLLDLVQGIIDFLLLRLAITMLLVLLARGRQVFRCGQIPIVDTLSLMPPGQVKLELPNIGGSGLLKLGDIV
jgi:hypothetical protein